MRVRSPRDPGKVAEYVLAAELLKRGYTPCWPSSAHAPYDIVLATRHGAIRVQVKGTVTSGKRIAVSCRKMPKERYTINDTDVIAVYLTSEKLWYFIPVEVDVPTSIYFTRKPDCRWARYQEAWDIFETVLGAP
jgi:uncharacterized protein YneR